MEGGRKAGSVVAWLLAASPRRPRRPEINPHPLGPGCVRWGRHDPEQHPRGHPMEGKKTGSPEDGIPPPPAHHGAAPVTPPRAVLPLRLVWLSPRKQGRRFLLSGVAGPPRARRVDTVGGAWRRPTEGGIHSGGRGSGPWPWPGGGRSRAGRATTDGGRGNGGLAFGALDRVQRGVSGIRDPGRSASGRTPLNPRVGDTDRAALSSPLGGKKRDLRGEWSRDNGVLCPHTHPPPLRLILGAATNPFPQGLWDFTGARSGGSGATAGRKGTHGYDTTARPGGWGKRREKGDAAGRVAEGPTGRAGPEAAGRIQPARPNHLGQGPAQKYGKKYIGAFGVQQKRLQKKPKGGRAIIVVLPEEGSEQTSRGDARHL